jgi:hypothetical protein
MPRSRDPSSLYSRTYESRQLNLASLDTGSAEDKSMQVAKSKLGAAKAALLQMHLALQSQQKSDTIAIRNEVTTGISALQDRYELITFHQPSPSGPSSSLVLSLARCARSLSRDFALHLLAVLLAEVWRKRVSEGGDYARWGGRDAAS